MYDLVIIGAGPAGMAAAIYAKRARLNAVVVEREGCGGQMAQTYEVDNYPGLPGISGFDLATKMKEHAVGLGAEIIYDDIKSIKKVDEKFVLTYETGSEVETKGIIIASGATHSKLGVPGEEKFAGAGVSYCATCDGAFFSQKSVAVVGGGDVAIEDAIFLSRIAKDVTLIHRRGELRGAASLQESLKQCENVNILWDTVVESINGDKKVETLSLKNVKDNEDFQLFVNGVFIAVGITPVKTQIDGLLCNAGGYIIADEDCRTNIKGVYAAGDVRGKRLRQIVTAVADGANAVTSFTEDFR
ncbi:MAG: thioredoxin-disulfide reductase [Lachnospiraceae bacterium]|nr:thioredoxin-disulfide reductase [Lachnospiraceae bacterium]